MTEQEQIEQQQKKNDQRRIDTLMSEMLYLQEQIDNKMDQVNNLVEAFERDHTHTQPALF